MGAEWGAAAMRYHKARAVPKPVAAFIIRHQTTSLNACVVIEHFGRWFDVRSMTNKEVAAFIDDLLRERSADIAAGLLVPH